MKFIKLTRVDHLPVYVKQEKILLIEGYPNYTKIFFEDYVSFVVVKEKPVEVYKLLKYEV